MDVTLALEHQDAQVYAKNLIVLLNYIQTLFFFHIQSIYIVSKENQTAGGK